MPIALILGGPLDGQRVLVGKERPRFLELLDDKGNTQVHFESDVIWQSARIEEPIFVHSSLQTAGFNLMSMLLAGYRGSSS